jgi:hypothetical protein
MLVLNNITDILDSAGRGIQRSFALSLRKDCEKLLTKITIDIVWGSSWGLGDDYLYNTVNTIAEIDMYDLTQQNRWRMR